MFLKTLLCISSVIFVNASLPKIKFEYKYSFKGPHLIQADRSIPFWEYTGDAIASDENIRITPSLRSKRGAVWCKNPATFEHFSIEVVFKVTGRGRVGADGLAIWFTESKGIDGPVFGSNDYWKGLAVIFDSFDNDAQHNNPYISAFVNDGTHTFEHQNDGSTQQLGGCLRDFRNKQFPIRAKVEYYERVLTVFINSGLTNNKDDFELCLRVENVQLPKSGFFGVSAATGGLADDHDVLAFLTHSLVPPGQQAVETKVAEDERKKYEKEFEDYQKQLEQAKKEFQEQHPEKAKEIGNDQYMGQGDRELQMIFEGQNLIHQNIRDLSHKLDELLGRQELVLSRVSSLSSGVQVPQGSGSQGGQPAMIDTIKRHEVERVFNNHAELLKEARDIRTVLNDVQYKAGVIQSGLGQVHQGGGATGGGGLNAQMSMIMHELQENLRNVRTDVTNLVQQPHIGTACPPPTSCVSPVLFFIAIGIQLVIIVGYLIYRQNKDAQAKKFY
ncbi:hypothetical protein CHS0354_042464 [Potamilus streckersoni]|uniref:L-type lectin-like domain-containing protein n=1 Tax=Potamilus streckersoni TaxID=2493646 RepID=A0AAE0SA90_9BIVA|nr:hypothetical protein CHS0354_042464 [Potamilus streckersoni]